MSDDDDLELQSEDTWKRHVTSNITDSDILHISDKKSYDAVFYTTDPLLYHKFWEYGDFLVRKVIFTL